MHTNFTAEIYSDMLKLYEFNFHYNEQTDEIKTNLFIVDDKEAVHSFMGKILKYDKDFKVISKLDSITNEIHEMLTKELNREVVYDFKDFGDVFRDQLQNDIFEEVSFENSKPIKYMIKFISITSKPQPSRGSFSISGRTLFEIKQG